MTYPPQQPFGAPAQPMPGPGSPVAARPQPYAGVPWTDHLRDGAALVLLLASLAMPWDLAHDATDRIEVVLATLLSVLSLSAMHLHRLGVIPATVPAETVALARALANVPAVLLVVVYSVIDLVQTFQGGGAQGVGAAAAFGVAGALLAAAPRACESAAARDPRALAETWRRVVLGVGGFAVAHAVLAFLATVINLVRAGGAFGASLPVAVALAVVFNALLAIAVHGALTLPALRRSAAGRVAAIAVAGAYLGATVVDLLSGWGLTGAYETGTMVAAPLLALGAAYLAAPVQDAMTPAAGAALYLPALSHLLLGFALYTIANAVTVMAILATGIVAPAVVISLVVLWCVMGAAFAAARATLRRDPLANRTAVVALAGAVVVAGIAILVIQAQGMLAGSTQRADLTVIVGIPLATAVLLYVPPSVRAYYAGAGVAAAGAAPATPQPVAPAPAPGAPVVPVVPPVDPYMAAVQHPATDAATLYRIATEAPWLHAYVAMHPNAYPDLLAWLASLGDPAVNAALAQRGR